MSQSTAPRWLKKLPLLIIVLLSILVLLAVIWRTQTRPETDDAWVYADTIDVVPEVSGRIVNLAVRDNQYVKKGDLLLQIDPRPYQENLTATQARLDALNQQIMLTQRTVNAQTYNAKSVKEIVGRARAVAKQAQDTRVRLEPLLKEGFASANEVDQAKTAERAAMAELSAAELQAQQAQAAITGVDALVAQRADLEAQIALAKLHLEYTEVHAPFNGRVVSLKTTVGQFASALKPLFTLIDTDHWYVVANFRETELNTIKPGDKARLRVLTNSKVQFDGTVDSIGYGVLPDDGGSVLNGLPLVRRSINWVHVSQRFPVKIAVENPAPDLFRIGASATATLYPVADKPAR